MTQTSNDTNTLGTLMIFVYGTLKQGQTNHDRFCGTALCIEEATAIGRLYELPSGIPVLRVPESSILAVGTSDHLADVATQEQFSNVAAGCGGTHWQMIEGELVVFTDPRLSLPPIDRLEGFRPGLRSMYRRVLVPVVTNRGVLPAWCYIDGGDLINIATPTGKRSWP